MSWLVPVGGAMLVSQRDAAAFEANDNVSHLDRRITLTDIRAAQDDFSVSS